MATTVSKALRVLGARGYATAGAHVTPVSGAPDADVQNTTLPNNLVVSSVDNEASISRISIVVRAGSRNENSSNVGVAHILRGAAGLSTRHATQFAITRNLQQVGAALTATGDREVIAYTLSGTTEAIEKSLPFLTEVVTQQAFKPWELADNAPRLHLELKLRPPQLRAVDLLHKAAFRSGLGNSLFASKHQLAKISTETLQHYVASNFTAGRVAVAGVGVNHAQLVQYAQSLALEAGAGSAGSSTYKGGEIRLEKSGDLAFVAIGGEGASLKVPKEALAFAVLQRALGVGPQLKWSATDTGVLTKAVGDVGEAYMATAINANYTDAGLFGVLVSAPADVAGKVVDGAVKVLKSGKVEDADVQRAKNQLQAAILGDNESGCNLVASVGLQAALLGGAQSPAQLAAAVDAISTADVKAALKKVSGSKLSIVSRGNLKTVPYIDSLQ